MTEIYDPSLSRHIWKKTKSFVKGTLEGIAYSFALSNFHDRLERCEIYLGENRMNGRALGVSANICAHAYLLLTLSDDKAIYSLIPIVLSNLISWASVNLKRREKIR
jgi:hypothetical protein